MEEQIVDKQYEIRPGVFTNKEQTEAVDFMLDFIVNSDNKEAILIGKGGTGKTTIINIVVEKLKEIRKFNKKRNRQEDFVVYAAAPSHSACNKLSEALNHNVSVYTIASILGMKLDIYSGKFKVDEFSRRENGVPVENCNVVIFDESSMIGENLKDYILRFTDSETKIIYMGDYRQLPPIREKGENKDLDADSPVFLLRDKVELTQRMRQGEESPIIPIIDFVGNCIETNSFRRIPTSLRVDNVADDKGVIFTRNAEWFLDAYCEDFIKDKENPYNVKGIAYTNDYRKRVNIALRKRLFPEDHHLQFTVGDVVTAFETFFISINQSIKNAESYIVRRVSYSDVTFQYTEFSDETGSFLMTPKLVTVKIKTVNLDLEFGDNFYYNIPVVDSNDVENLNKYTATIEYLASKRMFKEMYSFKENFADIQHGYVITSHKAQGHTYRNVYVLEDDIMGLKGVSLKTKFKSFYVAVSRPSNKLVLFSKVL